MAKVIMQFSNIRSWNTTLLCYWKTVQISNKKVQHIQHKTPKTHDHTQSNKMTGAAKQSNQHKPNQTVLNLKKKESYCK